MKKEIKKEITICFRTTDELRNALEGVARQDRRSLSSVIELILTDYVGKSQVLPHQRERRRNPRKVVSLRAHVKGGPKGKWEHEATVLDLSLSGLRLSLPKECMPDVYGAPGASQFETSFAVAEDGRALKFVCMPQRVVPVNGSAHVGARFVDSEFADYQELQQYLV